MRLLFVIDSLGSGGAQRQMTTLATGLKARGHRVEFFIYHPQYDHFRSELDQAEIPVHAIEKQRRFEISIPLALRTQIQSQSYDAVLAYLRTPNVYASLAKLLGSRTPLIVSERSADLADRPVTWRVWARRQLHRIADHVVVNSHHQRQRMERDLPWIKPKISTIVNGIDLDTFAPSSTQKADNILLAVGRVSAEKNPVALAQALVQLKEANAPLPTIRWAGRIPDKASNSPFATINAILEAHELTDHWEWLGVRKDVPSLLATASALIHPSLREGFPNVICEAMATETPVLASNIGDHAWLLSENRGLVFDPKSPTAIADTLQTFFTLSQTEKASMGANARSFAAQQLSTDQLVSSYETLFAEVRSPHGR